jgi:hypothetical protein
VKIEVRRIEGILLPNDFIPFPFGCLLFQVLVSHDRKMKRSSALAVFNSNNFLRRENPGACLLPFH